MDIFDLSAKLTLDSSDYETGIRRLSGGLKTIARVGGAALGAATTASVAFAKTSVSVGEEFDKAMSQVAATMGKTTEEMESDVGSVDLAWGTFTGNLRDYAQEMGRNTAFSATQVAQALNYMALAGYDTQTSMEMLPNVLNLAAAGGMDLARASDMVTDTQTAFGVSLERTSQMVDEMAKAASTGNTSVEQLGDAFLVVGGLAKELNGGFVTLEDGTLASVDGIQELEIAFTAMANAGIKGSEAGTHMRNMLMKLSSPTSDGTKRLEELGVSVFDDAGNMRSLADIMGELSSALGDLTQEEKINAISDLFNARDLASAEALLGAVSEDWDSIGASILDAGNASGKMAETQLDNLAGDITLFKSALEGAQIALSDKLTPSLREFVQFGTDGLSRITSAFQEGGLSAAMEELGNVLSEGLEKIIEDLPTIVDAGASLLSALIKGIVENMPKLADAFVQIVDTLINMVSNTEVVSTLVDAGAEIIIKLLEGVVSAFPKFANIVVKIVKTLAGGLSKNIKPLLKAASEAIITIIKTITDPQFIGELVSAGIELLLALIDGLFETLPVLIAAIPEIVQNLIDAFLSPDATRQFISAATQLIEALVKGFMECWPQIMAAAMQIIIALTSALLEPETNMLLIKSAFDIIIAIGKGIIDAIPQLLKTVPELLKALAKSVVENAKQLYHSAGDVLDKLGDGIKDGWEIIKKWGKIIIDKVVDSIKSGEAWETAKNIGRDIINRIWDGIKTMWETVKTWTPIIFAKIKAAASSAWDTIKNVGKDIVTGLWDGIKSMESWLKDKIFGWASGVVGWAKDALGIHSPSTVFANIGKFSAEGFEVGFDKAFDDVARNVEKQFDDLADQTSQISANVTGSMFGDSSSPALSQIYALLLDMRNNMGYDIVLDDGVIAGRVDKMLGQTALRKARGNA